MVIVKQLLLVMEKFSNYYYTTVQLRYILNRYNCDDSFKDVTRVRFSSFSSDGSVRRLPLVARGSSFFLSSARKMFDFLLAQIKARNCIPLTDWGLNNLLESERCKPLTGSACFVVLFSFGFVCLLFLSLICSV